MKNNKKMIVRCLSILLMSVLIACFATNVFATGGAFLNASDFEAKKANAKVRGMVNNTAAVVVTSLRIAGVTIALVMLLAIAMKYMVSSAGDRADIKKHAVAYVVGAVILFGATNIIAAIIDFTTQAVGS